MKSLFLNHPCSNIHLERDINRREQNDDTGILDEWCDEKKNNNKKYMLNQY